MERACRSAVEVISSLSLTRAGDETDVVEACLSAKSTNGTPWYIVTADDKNNARPTVSQVILDAFKALKLGFPETGAKRRQELLAIRQHLEKQA
jgi:hypothetical protein